MKSNQLKKTVKNRKRIGRGESSGQGRTAGRGDKGQKSRSGGNIPPGFEGGQNPLKKRIPKVGGFTRFGKEKARVVNLGQLESSFSVNQTVSPQVLVEKGLIRDGKGAVKILGDGVLKKKLVFKKCRFSQSAAKKLGIKIAPKAKRAKKVKESRKDKKDGRKKKKDPKGKTLKAKKKKK